ncbi:MAG: cell division protein ZapE [Aquiluna sp.]|nr:cell division protein ZapE [Aquiluna sp.]
MPRANSLIARHPEVSKSQLIGQLLPPPEFAEARFENYKPDPLFASQSEALKAAQGFIRGAKPKLFQKVSAEPGIYLDGGFGVGKTHLLASIWHGFVGKKAYGSFLEYTSLVGYLGFQNSVEALSKFGLVCIDEFELDDPGDTMIMSRLLKELEQRGVKFAATSNTPPNALGSGRFAAADFKREIQGLGSRFKIVSVDGDDYRHRDVRGESSNLSLEDLHIWGATHEESFSDEFEDVLKHLATLHPTKYRALVSGVSAIGIRGVRELDDQVDALRLVALIDRLYEFQVPIRSSGEVPLTSVFSEAMIAGAYRKKYLRTVSRIGALTSLI